LALPGLAAAVSEEDFQLKTTQNLVNLLTVSPNDPMYALFGDALFGDVLYYLYFNLIPF
jgi:hypothetical protein